MFGSTAVTFSVEPKIRPSPARTPETAVTPFALRASASAAIGNGSNPFCAVTP